MAESGTRFSGDCLSKPIFSKADIADDLDAILWALPHVEFRFPNRDAAAYQRRPIEKIEHWRNAMLSSELFCLHVTQYMWADGPYLPCFCQQGSVAEQLAILRLPKDERALLFCLEHSAWNEVRRLLTHHKEWSKVLWERVYKWLEAHPTCTCTLDDFTFIDLPSNRAA